MSDFTGIYPTPTLLDPAKRVNYIHGLVLGVDEFTQEEFYLLEKDRSHNRSLHGYGTVCGLKVELATSTAGVEVRVHPGQAVSPCGQVIHVARTQCAVIDQWLASHGDEISESLGSPALGNISLYLMLCYKECKTDIVPIPTGPCQSLEESTAPSRIADDFTLSLEINPPTEIHFQNPLQDLTELLLSINVEPGGSMTLDELKDWVRGLIPDDILSSPPMSSPPEEEAIASPPFINAIAPENVSEFFRAAFLVWVTEVKPCLTTTTQSHLLQTIPGDSSDKCVFLARIDLDVVTLDGLSRIDPAGEVEIDEQERQFILNTQAMQNFLGPLSSWSKVAADFVIPDGFSDALDTAGLVHISGEQVISGSKTFSAPITLDADARVLKSISLPAYQAHHGRGAARGLFSDTIPAMHFLTTGTNAFGGEALFSIPIPDDIDYTMPMQFRFIWGFQGEPEPSDIAFSWRVGARFYQASESVSTSPFEFVNIQISERSERRNDVLVTEFQNFDGDLILTGDHQYGIVRVSIIDPEVTIPQIYLLQMELQYTSNRLGGVV